MHTCMHMHTHLCMCMCAQASGVMASMTLLGSFIGFALFGFYLDVEHSYVLYCAAVLTTVLITCCAAREKVIKSAPPILCSELVAAYSIDAVAYPDFFWVFVTRTFYYMGLSIQATPNPKPNPNPQPNPGRPPLSCSPSRACSCPSPYSGIHPTQACSSPHPTQAFVLFMLRDVQKVADPKYTTSMLAMVGQLAALLVAVPSGRLSDRLGRKPLVYASCLVMAIVYIGFALAPSIQTVRWISPPPCHPPLTLPASHPAPRPR